MKQSLSSETDCFSASKEQSNFAKLRSSSPCLPEPTTRPALSHMRSGHTVVFYEMRFSITTLSAQAIHNELYK